LAASQPMIEIPSGNAGLGYLAITGQSAAVALTAGSID
jgi:hypothetical protein